MNAIKKIQDAEEWVLAIIGSDKMINGAIRMQKYGFLADNLILPRTSRMYKWIPHSFGAYSYEITSTLSDLEEKGMISIEHEDFEKGKKRRYRITKKGIDASKKFAERGKHEMGKIKKMVKYYSSRSEDELVADAYMLFPKFTYESKIKHRARRNILDRCKGGNRTIVLGYADKVIDLEKIVKLSASNQLTFADIDFTEELARNIGLPEDRYKCDKYESISDVFAGKEFAENMTSKDVREIIDSIR